MDSKTFDFDAEVLKLKGEAKNLLESMFKIPPGYGSDLITRVIDCIVSAAVLEVASQYKEGMDAARKVTVR